MSTHNDNQYKHDSGGEKQKNKQELEWKIGIRAWGPNDEPGEAQHEHYHPKASNKDEAIKKAKKEAQNGLNSIIGMQDAFEVYMVEGPFKMDHAE